MAKHIGIVACSAEGAALCYRTICIEGANLMGRYAHPEVTMHTFPLSEYMRYIKAGDWEGVASLMLSSAAKVARVGADFAICPDNTIHQAFDLVVEKSPIPWLHIAEEVAAEAKRQNYKCLGILGTRYLMEGPVYLTKLAAIDIEHMIPEAEDRKRINEIILSELVYGRFSTEARAYLSEVIGGLRKQGCDAVVLGCTEIPLLVTQEDSPLPTLDSTRLLARAALKRALEDGG
ncbi:MAG: aspartate racemase [Chloroflexi bacterium]|jgi:aspartate racemase|nr:MAG: aspartate racemase [Chloroflexota bacterium]